MDLSLFKPLKTDRIKEDFVLHLEQLILTEKIKAGEKLPPERKLAAHYGVSRPVIHEGILILENRGMVTLRPRHGVIVNNYRKQGTLDMLLSLLKEDGHELGPGLTADLEHLRIHMEKDIVSLICSRSKNPGIEYRELEEINRKMSTAKNAIELAELDFEFHLQMALEGGNTLYALLYNTLKPAHMDLLSKFYEHTTTRNQVVRFHEELIKALKSGDESAACLLIESGDAFSGYN